MEQDLRRDPETGLRMSDPANKDAKQNVHYKRHTDPQETSRDYSRPFTIPADEFEQTTGVDHSDAVAEFKANEATRVREAAEEARSKEHN